MPQVRDLINPALLQQALDFWFSHFTSARQLIAPPREAVSKWFKRDDELDKACVAKFGPALEAIRSADDSVTAEDLVSCIDRSASLDWVALVLLLDQIPRNAYRGERAAAAFTVFDPLAQEVARRAVDDEGVFGRDDVRRRAAYRCWFLFPFMHSEDGELHRRCVRMCEELVDDAARVEDEKDREVAVQFARTLLDFERRHQAIVERFGRYPHRNKVLGRVSTEEEEAYMRDGGETFGG